MEILEIRNLKPTLPNEIMRQVLEKLDSRNLLSFALVSKLYSYECLCILYSKVKFTNVLQRETFFNVINNVKFHTSCIDFGLVEEEEEEERTRENSVESLSSIRSSTTVNSTNPRYASVWQNHFISSYFKQIPKSIVKLNVSKGQYDPESLIDLLINLKELKYLDLSYSNLKSSTINGDLVGCFKRLEVLDLSGIFRLKRNDVGVLRLFIGSGLRVLVIRDCWDVDLKLKKELIQLGGSGFVLVD